MTGKNFYIIALLLFPLMSFGQLCPAGSFSSTGMEPCTLCPVDTFASDVGSLSCTPCPTYRKAPRVGSSVCGFCDAGQRLFSAFGNGACVSCLPGSASEAIDACIACGPETYQDRGGQPDCIPCPANQVTFSLSAISCTTNCRAFTTVPVIRASVVGGRRFLTITTVINLKRRFASDVRPLSKQTKIMLDVSKDPTYTFLTDSLSSWARIVDIQLGTERYSRKTRKGWLIGRDSSYIYLDRSLGTNLIQRIMFKPTRHSNRAHFKATIPYQGPFESDTFWQNAGVAVMLGGKIDSLCNYHKYANSSCSSIGCG